jgi:antitoxin YefM
MQAISMSQLRGNFKKYLDDVSKSEDIIIIPRTSDDDAVVLMSLKEFNSLNETGHLMSTKVNRERLKQSINQLQKGQTKKFKL